MPHTITASSTPIKTNVHRLVGDKGFALAFCCTILDGVINTATTLNSTAHDSPSPYLDTMYHNDALAPALPGEDI